MEAHQNPENTGKIGLRFNGGKLPVHLVPVSWIRGLSEVMKFGSTKYADRNWELGMKWSICYGCAMRHLMAWFGGESHDQESGLHHLLHAAWNCLAGYFYEVTGRYGEYDDRPDHSPAPPKIAYMCPNCNGGGYVNTITGESAECDRCYGKGYRE
jgi:hypothetical protein